MASTIPAAATGMGIAIGCIASGGMVAGVIAKLLFRDARGPILQIGPHANRRSNGLLLSILPLPSAAMQSSRSFAGLTWQPTETCN
ncbi:hypothetical protein RsS62_13880 [Rhizobium dioscoreae]|nr:hypothetical protein RsS62_13880 [Rhizobium dioscoreae]